MPTPTPEEVRAEIMAATTALNQLRATHATERAQMDERHADERRAAAAVCARAKRIQRLAYMDSRTRAALLADRPVGGARVWGSRHSDQPDLARGREWTDEGQILRAILRELEATDATNP